MYARSDSGLVYPVEGMDGAAVRAALKEHDRNLDLIQQLDPQWGRWVFKVTYATGGPSEVLFAWRAPSGEPLPLSSALIDKVKQLDRNTAFAAPDADHLNAQHLDERREDWEEARQDLKDDYLRRAKRQPILPRTTHWGNRRWKEKQSRR
jgi:hypothetical protein